MDLLSFFPQILISPLQHSRSAGLNDQVHGCHPPPHPEVSTGWSPSGRITLLLYLSHLNPPGSPVNLHIFPWHMLWPTTRCFCPTTPPKSPTSQRNTPTCVALRASLRISINRPVIYYVTKAGADYHVAPRSGRLAYLDGTVPAKVGEL